jgi:hypothetical protein
MTQLMHGRVPAELIASEQGDVTLRIPTFDPQLQVQTVEVELGHYSPQAFVDASGRVCAFARAACHLTLDLSFRDWNTEDRVSAFLVGTASGIDAVLDQWGWPTDGNNEPEATRFSDTMPVVRGGRELVGGALRARYAPAESYRIRLVFAIKSDGERDTVRVRFGFLANRG